MSEILIHCENIIKRYGHDEAEVLALRELSLDVKKGEMLFIVGPSGCGKTTFISCISGLLHFNSGVCHVLGKDMTAFSDEEMVSFRAKHIGFVFQSFQLLPALNCIENVSLGLTISGVSKKRAYPKAKKLLDSVGLHEKYNTKPKHLSGGEKQRVAIVRALIANPDIIICDEPTSSLDHKMGQEVMQLLDKIKNETQSTIIVVTHDDRIYKYADTIAYMEDGKILKIEEKLR